jgi:hypothetical protein
MLFNEFSAKKDVYQRNYAPRGGWMKSVDADLIDKKALKDSKLTRRENNPNMRHMFDFKNIL